MFKLMHPEPGETALSLAGADQDVALYRCFLKLCVLQPGTTIVPADQAANPTATARTGIATAGGRLINPHHPSRRR